jgi:hypothetical protein
MFNSPGATRATIIHDVTEDTNLQDSVATGSITVSDKGWPDLVEDDDEVGRGRPWNAEPGRANIRLPISRCNILAPAVAAPTSLRPRGRAFRRHH